MIKSRLLIALSAVVIALVVGVGLFASDRYTSAELAMSEMTVSKLTCGACVSNITTALADVAGIESVEVSITTGRSQVVFDPSLVNADQIAKVVTETGYPATVIRQLSAEQYQALQREEVSLAEIYIAKIGDQLLSREEFDQLVSQRMVTARVGDNPANRSQFVNQAWQSIKQRTLLLAAAEKNRVVVPDGEVDLRIRQMQTRMSNYDSYVESTFASKDDFFRQVKEDMIINKNIQKHVLAEVTSPDERQIKFNRWFQELIGNAAVTIYDPTLKQAASSSGGCGNGSGGGCCG